MHCTVDGCTERPVMKRMCQLHFADVRKAKQLERRCARYGIDPDEYERLYQGQGGGCAICGALQPDLFIDHDHTSGAVRGLLCSLCNLGLGYFADAEDRLTSAVAYLQQSRATEGECKKVA